jgi:PadR family transcriptional regulator PadR
MLILKTLALMPMHGYGIALRIEQISDGAFRVNPGSLLPALSRMERAGPREGRVASDREQPARSLLCPD